MKKRIGFFSYYGWGRGMCYVTKAYADMLKNDYDIYILKIDEKQIQPEFMDKKINIEQADGGFNISNDDFAIWLTKNKISAVVFNEYKQWANTQNNLIEVANKLGIKTYGYLVREKFRNYQTEKYSRLISPTLSMVKFYRQQRIRNFTYVPFSLDFKKEFKDEKNKQSRDVFTFFHQGGWGGVESRKNTKAVLDAYTKLNMSNTQQIGRASCRERV